MHQQLAGAHIVIEGDRAVLGRYVVMGRVERLRQLRRHPADGPRIHILVAKRRDQVVETQRLRDRGRGDIQRLHHHLRDGLATRERHVHLEQIAKDPRARLERRGQLLHRGTDIAGKGQLIDRTGQFGQLLVIEIAGDPRAIRRAIGKNRDPFLRIAVGGFSGRADHIAGAQRGRSRLAHLVDRRRPHAEAEGPDRFGIEELLILILNTVQQVHDICRRQRIARAQRHGMGRCVITDGCFTQIVIRLQDDGQRFVTALASVLGCDFDGIATRAQETTAAARQYDIGKRLVCGFGLGGENALRRKQIMRCPPDGIAVILGGQIDPGIDPGLVGVTDIFIKTVSAHLHQIANPQIDAGLRIIMIGQISHRQIAAADVFVKLAALRRAGQQVDLDLGRCPGTHDIEAKDELGNALDIRRDAARKILRPFGGAEDEAGCKFQRCPVRDVGEGLVAHDNLLGIAEDDLGKRLAGDGRGQPDIAHDFGQFDEGLELPAIALQAEVDVQVQVRIEPEFEPVDIHPVGVFMQARDPHGVEIEQRRNEILTHGFRVGDKILDLDAVAHLLQQATIGRERVVHLLQGRGRGGVAGRDREQIDLLMLVEPGDFRQFLG